MKKINFGIGALVVMLGVMSVLPSVTSAYKGDPAVKGPNYSPERHEAMLQAFETKDYTAWANLMQGRGRVMQVINKDNFAKFVEARNLAQQGKMAEAQKIRQELGLGLHNGMGRGSGPNR